MSGPYRPTEADALRDYANRKREPGKEGWGELRPGERTFHYYRNGRSLCSRVGFYSGSLDPDNGQPSSRDCKACRKALDHESRRNET